MNWFLISLFVAVIYFIWLANKPLYHRHIKLKDIHRFIEVLVSNGADDSLMFIKHEDSELFVQFAIHGNKKTGSILHFGFPDAPWSRNYFEAIRQRFEDAGVDYIINPTNEEPVTKFIVVNMEGSDDEKTNAGVQITNLTFQAMGLGEDDEYRIKYEAQVSKESIRRLREEMRHMKNKRHK